MTTATELRAQRQAAGASYAAALEELKAKWIALRALDLACQNEHMRSFQQHATPIGSFNVNLSQASSLSHPQFTSDEHLSLWHDEAKAAAEGHVEAASAAARRAAYEASEREAAAAREEGGEAGTAATTAETTNSAGDQAG